MNPPASKPEVVLGVSGGIAAYKACELLRLLTESGHGVTVTPTAAALRFVGEATWAALSGRPVAVDVFDDAHEVPHVALGRRADLVVVAPASADLLARAASGRADDMLTSTLLTATCPVLFAPAMHTEMWEHPATVDNTAVLRRRGAVVLEPASGRLTGADTGKGRLPEPAEIFEAARRLLRRGATAKPDLAGRRVVVTAGGTREPLDPVRFIGNRSSGKQGYALARTAAARGAAVTVVAANVTLPVPAGVEVIEVETTAQLREATVAAAADADVTVMAAAPADFRPERYASHKIKKSPDAAGLTVDLVETPDVAAEIGASKGDGQLLVVFAAETRDGVESARAKLTRKRADLAVLNLVGEGKAFGLDENAVTLVRPDGSVVEVPTSAKDDVADAIWDAVVSVLSGRP
ncbi:MAG: bifunctional phosphopantothenoylcysteine decarboxylase/phosphopantothenate--cysteine ligase CoaBC [Stackebrandtia sp.]